MWCHTKGSRWGFQTQFGIRKYNLLFTESDKSFVEVDRNTSRTNLANPAGTEESTMKTINVQWKQSMVLIATQATSKLQTKAESGRIEVCVWCFYVYVSFLK